MTSQAMFWAAGVSTGALLNAIECPLSLMIILTAAMVIAISWEAA